MTDWAVITEWDLVGANKPEGCCKNKYTAGTITEADELVRIILPEPGKCFTTYHVPRHAGRLFKTLVMILTTSEVATP